MTVYKPPPPTATHQPLPLLLYLILGGAGLVVVVVPIKGVVSVGGFDGSGAIVAEEPAPANVAAL